MSEMKMNKDENTKKSNAFMADSGERNKSELICHNCGRADYFKKECTYNSQHGNNKPWKKTQSMQSTRGREALEEAILGEALREEGARDFVETRRVRLQTDTEKINIRNPTTTQDQAHGLQR